MPAYFSRSSAASRLAPWLPEVGGRNGAIIGGAVGGTAAITTDDKSNNSKNEKHNSSKYLNPNLVLQWRENEQIEHRDFPIYLRGIPAGIC
jgi:hypothetical protein